MTDVRLEAAEAIADVAQHRVEAGGAMAVLSALVASGRAIALLPALLATAMPQAAETPAIVAVREALRDTARRVAARQRNLEVLA